MPGSLLSRYSPVPGRSVPFCCVTRYCSGESFRIASSLWVNFRISFSSDVYGMNVEPVELVGQGGELRSLRHEARSRTCPLHVSLPSGPRGRRGTPRDSFTTPFGTISAVLIGERGRSCDEP